MYFLEEPASTIAEGLVALHDIKKKFEKVKITLTLTLVVVKGDFV